MTIHWNEKRYYSLDYYLKENYGEKLYKLSLNGGMTCPTGTAHWTREAVFSAAGAVPVILLPTPQFLLQSRLSRQKHL